MPKATVFIDQENQEPTTVDKDKILEGIQGLLLDGDSGSDLHWDDVLAPVEDYHVVSEVSLRAAVMALQSIRLQARCHYSRTVARQALRWIGMTGDLPTDPEGYPESITSLPGGQHLGEVLSVESPYDLG